MPELSAAAPDRGTQRETPPLQRPRKVAARGGEGPRPARGTLVAPRVAARRCLTRAQRSAYAEGMLRVLLVEDNERLRPALKSGLEADGRGAGDRRLRQRRGRAGRLPGRPARRGPDGRATGRRDERHRGGCRASAASSRACRSSSTRSRTTTPITATSGAPASSATTPTCASRTTCCRR